MGMGIAGLMTGAGAGQGLEALLKQRLMEREMALREQQAQAQQQQHAAELQMRGQENAATREANDWYRQMMAGQRQQGLDQSNAENLVQSTPVGGSVSAPDANLMQRGGQGGVLRTIPMTGMTTEGGPAPPVRFRGYTPQESMRREDLASAQDDRVSAREDSQAATAENARLNRENSSAIAGLRRDARIITTQEYDPETQTLVTVGRDPETGTEQWRAGGKMTADAMGRTAAYGRAGVIVNKLAQQAERIQLQEGAAARLQEPKQRAEAYANIDLDTAEYMSTLKAFAPLIARSLGHTGVLTELDVESVRQGFWQPGESGELRQRKFDNVRGIMEMMKQPGKAASSGAPPKTTPSAPSGGAKPGEMKTTPHGTFSFDGTGWVKVGGQ